MQVTLESGEAVCCMCRFPLVGNTHPQPVFFTGTNPHNTNTAQHQHVFFTGGVKGQLTEWRVTHQGQFERLRQVAALGSQISRVSAWLPRYLAASTTGDPCKLHVFDGESLYPG